MSTDSMSKLATRNPFGSTQRGAVLVVALVFLLLMTLLGSAAMQDTAMQERMAGNHRDRNLALQAAEAALRAGGVWVDEENNAASSDNSFAYTNVPTDEQSSEGTEDTLITAGRLVDPAKWNGKLPAKPEGLTAANEQLTAKFGQLFQPPSGDPNPAFHLGAPLLYLKDQLDPQGGTGSIYPITARAMGGTATAVVILQRNYCRVANPCN